MKRSGHLALAIAATCVCGLAYTVGYAKRDSRTFLSTEVLFTDDALGWITDLALVRGQIIAIDAMLDPALHIFESSNLQRLGSYGRSGDGPGEFKDPDHIVTGDPESDEGIWILDGVHQRLTRLSPTEIVMGSVPVPETLSLDGPKAASFVRSPDGRWFAGGWIPGGRVARYREDWSYERTIVGFPPEADDAPGITLPQAYESLVAIDPAGGRFAAATRAGGVMEFFDYDGVLITRAEVPEPFQPQWRQGRSHGGRPVMSVGPETRYGFTDLAATALYVYGLFSGQRVMEPGTPWATREVQIYTWAGAYVKTLHLDRTAEALAVDSSDTWLYASGPDPSPWVGRFRLPEP